MKEALQIGRIRGVAVRLHWSLLAIFWLVAFTLAESELPAREPEQSVVAYWVVGSIAATMFLGSILAHEVAHSLVALRQGIKVEDITLWLFGGMATMSGPAPTARAEWRVAIVGPLTSVTVAVVAGAAALVLDGSGTVALASSALGWLALANLLLAGFNLIPAAPLDGGRVLAAVLWRRSGDRVGAAVRAARVGQSFGRVLVGLGLLLFFLGGQLGGLWLVFLGWFLLGAARAEEQAVTVTDRLAGVQLADIMTPDPLTAPADLPVQALIDELIMTSRCSSFPVLERDGTVVGLVTLAGVKRLPVADRHRRTVRDVMVPLADVPTARPDDPVTVVIGRPAGESRGRVLVTRDGVLVGIVSPADVARLLERFEIDRGLVGGDRRRGRSSLPEPPPHRDGPERIRDAGAEGSARRP